MAEGGGFSSASVRTSDLDFFSERAGLAFAFFFSPWLRWLFCRSRLFLVLIKLGDGVRQPWCLDRAARCRTAALPLLRSMVATDLCNAATCKRRLIVFID